MKINDKISKEILKKLTKNFGLEKILDLAMNRTTLNNDKKLNSVIQAVFDLGDVYILTKSLIDQSNLFQLNEESTTEENSGKIININNKIKDVNCEKFLNNKRKRINEQNDNNDDENNNNNDNNENNNFNIINNNIIINKPLSNNNRFNINVKNLENKFIYNNNNNNNKNGMKTMNMNNNINNNKKEDRKEVINKAQNEKSNYSFIDSNRKFRYVYDDGAIFLTDDSGFFCFDNISLRMKDYIFMENMKSPYLKFISTFFG